MKATIHTISSNPTSKNSTGYYYQVFSEGVLNINSFVKLCVECVGGYKLEPSSSSLGRIDLENGSVISLDFVLTGRTEASGTSGSSLGLTEDGKGIWGNRWQVSMSAITMSGERNLIQTFNFTQPMLSRYSDLSDRSIVEEKHTQLVKDHLNRGVEPFLSFLKHYLKRISR